MARMDFGLTIRPTTHGGTLAEMARANALLLAAAREYDLACWVIDHFQFDDQPIFESLAFLAHHAGANPGLRWGNLVLGQRYRNPALTAKIAASLQFLTGGRYILGIGGGDAEREHRAYGYDFPAAPDRIAQLDEAARVIRALWTGGPATFHGDHYRIEDASCRPAPEPPPLLMIGGAGERRTLRVVAEHADWWNADYYTPAEYAHKLAVLHAHCRAVGRDPAAIVPTCYLGISLSDDPERLIRRRFMGHRGEVHVISGDADAVAAGIAAFAAAGARYAQLNFLDFPRTEGIERFLAAVLPRFERGGL